MAKKPAGDKKGKKARKAASTTNDAPRLNGHPTARRHIRTAKGYGSVGTFLIVGWMAVHHGMPAFDAGMRALMAGIAAYLLTWTAAVVIWRQVAVAQVIQLQSELRVAHEAAMDARREAQAA